MHSTNTSGEERQEDSKGTKEAGTSSKDEELEIKMIYFRGLPLHGRPFDFEALEKVVEFKPDPGDIFVVTYPKCGTTWTQFIVWGIVNKGAPPPTPNQMMFHHFPFLEYVGVENLHELPRPRLMKTHLPFHLQPYHSSAKYIYVVRNPWDCCVSYYHHIQVDFPEGKTFPFEKFFDHFIQGKLPFGDFFDHVIPWYAHKNDSNVLLLTYENMSSDPKGTIMKIAKFLGDQYYDMLMNDEEILNNCLKYSEFKYMKKLGMFVPREAVAENKTKAFDKNFMEKFVKSLQSLNKDNVDLEKFRESNFFRKGAIGDWKNYFTEDHVRRFKEYISAKVSDTVLEGIWLLRHMDENLMYASSISEEEYQTEAKETKAAEPIEDEELEIKLTYFRGFPFPGPPFDLDSIEKVVDFTPDSGDIFVVTYPKCGTTWAQFIVWEIVNKGEPPPSPNQMMFNHFPFLEYYGVENLHKLSRPRLMKTHLPYHLQPYHPSAKYIYVVRNPWDCCVSYYHHIQVEFPEDKRLPFEKFFDHFVQGKVPFGDFFDHIIPWYAHRNDPNLLFLTYENMLADRKGTMMKIAKFLGDEYYDKLMNDEEVLNNCLKHSEFKYMKNLGMFLPKDVNTKDTSKPVDKDFMKNFMEALGSVDKDNLNPEKFRVWDFFRKGVIGDWKNYFTENHIRRFNEYVSAKVQGCDIKDLWTVEHQVENSIPTSSTSEGDCQIESKEKQETVAPREEEPLEIKIAYFRGVPFPGPPFDLDVLKEVIEFKPDHSDVFVVTYPKCGTTWTQFIVWEIINRGAPPPSPNQMMFVHFPFLEVTGVGHLGELPRPRLMKTHLPFQLQPFHPSAKYIYVVRNPWDCCVSYYHHIHVEFPEGRAFPFEKFFDHFVQGKLPFGDFFDHVHSWYAHKNDPNILFLTYENMTADPKGAILKIAKFLGDTYYDILMNNEQILNNCLRHSEFKYMKDLGMFVPKHTHMVDKSKPMDKNVMKFCIESLRSVDKNNVDFEKFRVWEFFRKGIVGDWKNYFTENQIQRFNEYISAKVSGTDIEDMWMLASSK